MNKALIVLGATVFGLACASLSDVHAQSGLLDVGKGLLKSQSGLSLPQSSGNLGANLSSSDIGAGLKDALKVASERVTNRLGAPNGFNGDPAVHIPLPEKLRMVQQGLKSAGQSELLVQ